MVWRVNGHSPSYVHENRESAYAEAGRLARQHVGDQFIVLKSVRGFQVDVPPPPPIREFGMSEFEFDNIPF